MSLSVVIITLNAIEHIRNCLESVKWAEEIIVLDSGSTDGTIDLCKEYTPHVYQTDWPGFGRQKNRAIGYATQDWILVLDADERLSEELQTEIRSVMSERGHVVAYRMKRLSTFMDKLIRHGDWGKDWVIRLFQKDAGQYTESLVHEHLLVKGAVGNLYATLQHNTVTQLETALHKLNVYSTLGAQQMQERGRRGGLARACVSALWSFCRGYVVKFGFLDGQEGYLIALLTAQGSFYKYVKCNYFTKN